MNASLSTDDRKVAAAPSLESSAKKVNASNLARPFPTCPLTQDSADIVLDFQGYIVNCSESAALIFGTAPGALTGRHIMDFIPGIHLSPDAPKNSIDFAAFCGKWDFWHDHRIQDRSGKQILVKVLLKAVSAHPHHLIRLSISEPRPLAGTKPP